MVRELEPAGGGLDPETKGKGAEPVMDDDVMAPLARWFQLIATRGEAGRADGANGADSGSSVTPSTWPLIAHVDRDPFCPCVGAPCLGSLPRRTVASFAAFCGINFFFLMGTYVILANYTPLFTLAADTWTHVWSAVACTLVILLQASYQLLAQLTFARNDSSLQATSLETRLQVRAFRLALGSLVSRFRQAELFATDLPPESLPIPADAELHVVLFRALAPTWRFRAAYHGVLHALIVGLFFHHLLSSVFYLVGGACLPAYELMALGYYLCFVFLQLGNLVRSNAKLDAVARLFAQARAELRLLRIRLGPAGGPLRDRAADAIAALSTALEGGADMRATFLRVPVSVGLIRTAAASLLTVGLAAFGLLRGAGVYVTVQNVCWAT